MPINYIMTPGHDDGRKYFFLYCCSSCCSCFCGCSCDPNPDPKPYTLNHKCYTLRRLQLCEPGYLFQLPRISKLWLPPNERDNRNRDTLGIQPSQEIHLYFHAAFGPSGRHVTPTGLRFHHVEQRVCMRFYKSILTYVLLQAQWRSGTWGILGRTPETGAPTFIHHVL